MAHRHSSELDTIRAGWEKSYELAKCATEIANCGREREKSRDDAERLYTDAYFGRDWTTTRFGLADFFLVLAIVGRVVAMITKKLFLELISTRSWKLLTLLITIEFAAVALKLLELWLARRVRRFHLRVFVALLAVIVNVIDIVYAVDSSGGSGNAAVDRKNKVSVLVKGIGVDVSQTMITWIGLLREAQSLLGTQEPWSAYARLAFLGQIPSKVQFNALPDSEKLYVERTILRMVETRISGEIIATLAMGEKKAPPGQEGAPAAQAAEQQAAAGKDGRLSVEVAEAQEGETGDALQQLLLQSPAGQDAPDTEATQRQEEEAGDAEPNTGLTAPIIIPSPAASQRSSQGEIHDAVPPLPTAPVNTAREVPGYMRDTASSKMRRQSGSSSSREGSIPPSMRRRPVVTQSKDRPKIADSKNLSHSAPPDSPSKHERN